MEIICKKTTDWKSEEWDTYTRSFNEVFEKAYTNQDFEHKYCLTIDGYSYHAFLLHDDSVVGSCTVIPYEYLFKDQVVRIGLAVDVFIVEEHRTDSLALFTMYRKLKEVLKEQDISKVVAIPNNVAYPFWKNIVKWKDIGFLGYYALPVRLGNVISKAPLVLNTLSRTGTWFLLTFSHLIRSVEKEKQFRINRESHIVEEHRYTEDHKKVVTGNSFFSYRIVDEDLVKTCYLIDFYNKNTKKRNSRTLTRAIHHITKNEKVDVIIFVGDLPLFQLLLFKIPYNREPRHLYFMIDDLVKGNGSEERDIYIYKNWDFGLFNFDVR